MEALDPHEQAGWTFGGRDGVQQGQGMVHVGDEFQAVVGVDGGTDGGVDAAADQRELAGRAEQGREDIAAGGGL